MVELLLNSFCLNFMYENSYICKLIICTVVLILLSLRLYYAVDHQVLTLVLTRAQKLAH